MMKMKCDFCGNSKEGVVRTHYGSTNYTRLICQDCIQEINQNDQAAFGKESLNKDGSFKNE